MGPQPLPVEDPTVCNPAELAQIQAHFGISLKDTNPEVIRHIVDRSKQAGNDAFRQRNYKEAVKIYSQAIAGAATDHTLFGNRSAAYLALGLYEQAAWDARKAVALRGDWPKGYYRLGCAYLALSQWAEAEQVLQQGLELEPANADMEAKLEQARQRAGAEAAARRAQADTERRGVVAKLRAARRQDQQLAMLNQFKQSMVGPDWELDDLEWRPTFLPAMKLQPLRPEAVLADPRKQVLAGYLAALADLAHPKQALRILEDTPRLRAFQQGISAALLQKPRADVLVLGAGGGLLSLLAAQAGAGSVMAVERSRMLYRMAKQCLESNAEQQGEVVGRVRLVDRRLQAVGVAGEPLPPDAQLVLEQRQLAQQAAAAPVAAGPSSNSSSAEDLDEDGDAAALLPRRASVLVTDLLDHSVLGMGLLPALDYAAERLLAPGALVVPHRVQVFAVLLELRVDSINGFDLSALNAYWWHPHAERMDLGRMPHRRLSAPFEVHSLDLQARLDDAQGRPSSPSHGSGGGGGCDGSSNSNSSSSMDGEQDRAARMEAVWELDASMEVPVTADGQWNAIAFWFEVQADAGGSAIVSSWCAGSSGEASHGRDDSSSGAPPSGPAAGRSWDQAVQYVDSQAVSRGSMLKLRVRQDSGQYVFTSQPPQCRPRHALVPRWHFDMVLDQQRNDAYEAAIQRAVQKKRAAGCTELLALDVGAGSGLLSMMAARVGADAVYAAEISQHMCDVGEEATIMNGFLGRINMLDRDARRLDVHRKPDGTPPDLPRRADLLVYEVFDSGCIGEGVLHLLAAAQAKLLASDAAMVPLSARVYCQPIQMRVGQVLGFDCSQANRWRWRPDYEGVELGRCRDQWLPLAEPTEAFFFDFQDAAAHMQPAQTALNLLCTTGGVCNAVAMWFDLHLDEQTTLSTCPYANKGLTWQQAVQWVGEVQVMAGQELQLTASHDTYSISYSLGYSTAGSVTEAGQVSAGHTLPEPTGVPLVDPAWQAAYERLQGLNSQLVKACVQNPLEYRAVAQAALQFAARPHDLGVDAQQAVEFCVKMMG